LLRVGNLWKPVGHGQFDYHTEVTPLRFSLDHCEGFQWILERPSNISVDPIKHALNQGIGETIVCLMIDSNINTSIVRR
jgi:hypothetical protein